MKKDFSVKVTDRVSMDMQSIGELWKSLAEFCTSRVEDNELYEGKYLIETRKRQIVTLKALVGVVEEFHKEFTCLKSNN